MKIFPHILCRVGGLSFDELAKLNYSVAFCDLLAKQRFLEADFERCKSELLADLKSFDATFSEFPTIRKMKKLIHKNRSLSSTTLESSTTLQSGVEIPNLPHTTLESSTTLQSGVKIPNLPHTTLESSATYNGLLIQKKELTKMLETQLIIENLRIKTELQTLSKNPNFLNALPLSSIILAKSLKNYWNKNPKDFRKKELQTEQTVMKYLARMAAKTSPFSSFTKVSTTTLESSTTLQSGVKKTHIKPFPTTFKSSTTLQSGVKKTNIKPFPTTLESGGTFESGVKKTNIKPFPTTLESGGTFESGVEKTHIKSFPTTLESGGTFESGVEKTNIKPFYTTLESGGTFESGVKKTNIKSFYTTLESGGTYNNFLLQIFQTLFITNEKIFKYLKIRINSTLEKGDLEYRFLVNVQNIESFQRVEVQPILELFESYFIDNDGFFIFELINKIGEEVEAETADLLDFVQELVKIGFLQVDFGFHGNMENWLGKVRNFVEQTPVFDAADVEFFVDLERQLVDFQSAKIWERISILENTHGEIQAFLEKYGFNENLTEILSLEQLIYEDVIRSEIPSFEAKGIEKLVFSLHELLEKINFIQGKERLQIAHFFNNFYDDTAIIPLLDFYENYYKIGKQIKETEIPAIQAEAELLKNWAKAVGEIVLEKYEMDTVLELEISDFDKINERLNIQPKPLKGLSLGCFAQMYSEENELKAVLNGVMLGYGKMTGRFLKLTAQAFTDDLRKFNAALGKETLMADNVDASFFNANIHPPLLAYEISMPKSQNQLPENRQLKVNDLVIRKMNNEIVLWHLKLEKKVQVFDLGIQTPKGRSPLYQLLMNFSPNVPDLQYLKEAIEAGIPQNGKNNKIFPRVIFKNWVIFRKSWTFQNWEILYKIENKTELGVLQALKFALKQNKIRSKFYIKQKRNISIESVHNRKENKPIYIDINNVILKNIFLKRIKNKDFLCEISEMLPIDDNLIKIKESPFYIESVLQWYRS
jgi:pectate lyase